MKFVSVSEMIAIEKEANSIGLTYKTMMENAGRGLAEVVQDEFLHLKQSGIVGIIGSGNNGGDTLVALRHLAKEGWITCAYIVGKRDPQDPLIDALVQAGGVIKTIDNDHDFQILRNLLERNAILLDGLLGTGIKLPLRGMVADVLNFIHWRINELDLTPVIIAVDCPSGMDCDSGAIAREALSADLTVTMAAVKKGLLSFPAYDYIGDLRLVGIGLPDNGEGLNSWKKIETFIPEVDWVQKNIPKRPGNAHKGTFGTALIIAGSTNYTGAALLAGKGAYRIGAGLVTIAVPEPIQTSLAGHLSEATWLPLPHENGVIHEDAYTSILDNLSRVTGALIGPGFGLSNTTARFLSNLLNTSDNLTMFPPVVIDADGLKLLKNIENWQVMIPEGSVLTPHPGEMSVLTDLSVEEIQSQRVDIARRYSKSWGHTVVLKGAFSVIASPQGKTAIIPVATPALARAGTGDVLAGIIVGLIAQGVESFAAAVTGSWIHAQAGLRATEIVGNTASVMAGDVASAIIDVINDLN